jgi:hypothetical protein
VPAWSRKHSHLWKSVQFSESLHLIFLLTLLVCSRKRIHD